MEIELLTDQSDLRNKGIEYFWKCWGNDSNFNFYRDCIEHSFSNESHLPKFFLLLDAGVIVGSYALVTNDLISRQDLIPWLASLYVNPTHRNRGLAEVLLKHGLAEARKMGYDTLYLSTDHNDFYEKKGWEFLAQGYRIDGEETKIYSHSLETLAPS